MSNLKYMPLELKLILLVIFLIGILGLANLNLGIFLDKIISIVTYILN